MELSFKEASVVIGGRPQAASRDTTERTFEGPGRLGAFATAMALSSLVTSVSFQEPRFALVVSAVALVLLVWNNSVSLLLTLCGLVAARILWRLPEGPNHYILELLVCVGFLLSGLALRRRSNAEELLSRAAPVGRALMLIVYFFAVLDKMNWDYLSPHGCGWALVSPFLGGDAAASAYPLLWRLGNYGSLSVEAFLFVGLAVPGLRRYALFTGAIFHSLLAAVPFQGVASFSSLTLALYVLFMPDGSDWTRWGLLPGLVDGRRRAVILIGGGLAYLGATFLASRWLAAQAFPNLASYGSVDSARDLANVFWSALMFVPMGAWLVASVFGSMPQKAERLRLLPKGVLLLLPALAIFNGLCPFLGLKTQTSFAMFSNLRTEQGRFNHLFLPASMQVFDYQKEVIVVTKAPRSFTGNDEIRLVPIEFRRRFARMKPGEKVTFLREGAPYTLTKGAAPTANKDLATPLSFWQARLLRFRPVVDEPQPCRH